MAERNLAESGAAKEPGEAATGRGYPRLQEPFAPGNGNRTRVAHARNPQAWAATPGVAQSWFITSTDSECKARMRSTISARLSTTKS